LRRVVGSVAEDGAESSRSRTRYGADTVFSGPNRADRRWSLRVVVCPVRLVGDPFLGVFTSRGSPLPPLVNAEGDVVGVVVATADVPTFIQATDTIPQNINWAVKSLFASALFTPPFAGVTPSTDRADIIERVQEATCLVRITRSSSRFIAVDRAEWSTPRVVGSGSRHASPTGAGSLNGR